MTVVSFNTFLVLLQMQIVLKCFSACEHDQVQNKPTTRKAQIIDDILHSLQRDKLPKNDNGHKLNMNLFVDSLFDISEKDFSFKIIYTMTVFWIDKRFEFEPFTDEDGMENNDIFLDVNIFKEKGM